MRSEGISTEDKQRLLGAALLWLLNHYEIGTNDQQLKKRVVTRIEDVLEKTGVDVSIADLVAFRKAFSEK